MPLLNASGRIATSSTVPISRPAGLFDLIRSAPATLRYENQLIVAEGDYLIAHGPLLGHRAPCRLDRRRREVTVTVQLTRLRRSAPPGAFRCALQEPDARRPEAIMSPRRMERSRKCIE